MKTLCIAVAASLLAVTSHALAKPAEALERIQPTSTSPPAVSVPGKIADSPHSFFPPFPYISHLVLYPRQEQLVDTQYGRIKFPVASVAYIYQTMNSMAVYTLDSTRDEAVQIVVGDKKITVPVGTEAVLTKLAKAKFADVNPKSGILFRGVKLDTTAGETKVFKTEFMILAAVRQIAGLKKLYESPDKEKQKQLEPLLKRAGVLQPSAKQEMKGNLRFATTTGIVEQSKSVVLQGAAEVHENPNEKSINLSTTVAQDIQGDADQDLRLVKEQDKDWNILNSRSPKSAHVTAVLTCSKDCLIKTELTTIGCKQGAIIFVDNHRTYMTICVVDSKGLHDVTVHLPTGHFIKMSPGGALLLHRQNAAKVEPQAAHLLSYSSWAKARVSDIDVYSGDVSLPSVMSSVVPLRAMIESSDPQERKKALRILKNAAVIAHLDGGQ